MAIWRSTRKDEKHLEKTAKVGDTYYGLINISQVTAPYEDPQLVDGWTVTHMHPIFGGPMCGSRSLASLLHEHGELSTTRPKGFRAVWEPRPQVAGPLGDDTVRHLDEAEIRGLEKQVMDNIAEQRKAGRRRWR